MTGTEKQIKWAEDIKATYMEKMAEAAEYFKKVIESGSEDVDNYPTSALVFVKAYHSNATYEAVKSEMKSSDLYKEFAEAQRGTPEKKAAGKAFRSAVATEALSRLNKAVADMTAIEDAAYWIENRMR